MPLVEMSGIVKHFPGSGQRALDGVGFALAEGEVVALVGENGAGKSTLMRALAGTVAVDAGKILVRGGELRGREGAGLSAAAQRAGVAMVAQHPLLAPKLTVLENCALGAEGGALLRGFGKRKGAIARLAANLGAEGILGARAGELSANKRTIAAVLAALALDPAVLVLDEPFDSLTPGESLSLYALVRRFAAGGGKAAVIVTHRLAEALEWSSRVVAMRGGRIAGEAASAALGEAALAAMMFGPGAGSLSAGSSRPQAPVRAESAEAPALRFEGVSLRSGGRTRLAELDLRVAPGEVLGVTGIREEGPEAVEKLAAGELRPSAGTVHVLGRDVTAAGTGPRRALGMAYLASDRLGRASEPRLSLAENLAIARYAAGPAPFGKRLLYPAREMAAWAAALARGAGVDADPRAPLSSYSGGSIQRLLFAREASVAPRLLVLAEPGRGVDLEGKALIARRLAELAGAGCAVLVVSGDLDDLIALCDRAVVLAGGRKSGELVLRGPGGEPPGEGERAAAREKLGALMLSTRVPA